LSADEEIFYDDFYNNSSLSVTFESSVTRRDGNDESDANSVTQIYGTNAVDIGRKERDADDAETAELERDAADDDEEVEIVGCVQASMIENFLMRH
jgi:hypothetical protein